MNALPPPLSPLQPSPRPAVSYGRMMVLAQRRFSEQQQRSAAAA